MGRGTPSVPAGKRGRGRECVGEPIGKEHRLRSEIDLGLNLTSATNQLGDHE